jgi:FkbM family methyltransferase
MTIRLSTFPLQRVVRALPRPLRRIRCAQLLATLTGTPYHRVSFQQGELVGNVRDRAVANSLVQAAAADYGYLELAGRLLRQGDVHVDLGANYGFHTFGLLRSPISSSIRYLLIDANPDCIACLLASAQLYPALQIQVVHAAAAAAAGEVRFTFAPSETGVGHVVASGGVGGVEIRVPAMPLDALFGKSGIETIGLLKMDIEGSEPFAMQGLSGMLSSHRVNFVYFEVNPACLALLHTDAQALFAQFTRHGYRLFWPHDGMDWIERTYGSGNAASTSVTKRFRVWGSQPHTVVAFDHTRYRKEKFGQCDLLAVSPNCRVDELG